MVDAPASPVNGQPLTNEEKRLAELRIMDDPRPPRPDVDDVERLYESGLVDRDFVNQHRCRGGPCSDNSLCDYCRVTRKYLLVRIHRAKYGKYVHPADAAGYDPPKPKTGAQLILAYFLERWKPVFRRGATIHCADGEELTQQIACVPDSEIILRLGTAVDAPKDRNGVNPDALPSFFRKWSAVAWGDLRAQVPEEIHAQLGENAPARETFRRLVREALCQQLTFGDVIGRQGVTQVERRSLIGWTVKFAKLGPWRDIRSLACWCRLTEPTAGELLLHVAIRHELFAQVGADRRLREMGATMFARLVSKYGVGTSTEKDRPHGRRAIVLDHDLVADLTAGLADDENLPPASDTGVSSEEAASNF